MNLIKRSPERIIFINNVFVKEQFIYDYYWISVNDFFEGASYFELQLLSF